MPHFQSILLFLVLLQCSLLQAQFPPGANMEGSTAIHADSSLLINWATHCELNRGPIDITDPEATLVSIGDESMALGPAGSNGIVSLGDGGSATLTFEYPITNGEGWDFAVFENGFSSADGYFLELAFVEVSSDGVHFVRFPSISLTDTTSQLSNFDLLYPSNIHNLAGKYELFFGTPFDLEELINEPGLDVSAVTHVRLIDVVGSLEEPYASYDSEGRKINDPWPTAFESCGFDLDAVGVIHENRISSTSSGFDGSTDLIFPNPAKSGAMIYFQGENKEPFAIFDASGGLMTQGHSMGGQIQLPKLSPGMYWVKIQGQYQKLLLID